MSIRALGLNALLGIFATIAPTHGASLFDFADVPLYSSLAPCARSAVSYAINSLTYSKCPEGITALQSCACTKDQNAVAIQSTISKSVSYSCGATATEDMASASQVFFQYCNQDATITTAAPGPTLVSQYITDLAAFAYLAPCAASAVSYAVQSLTYSDCPEGASALNSCACTKNQNSQAASQDINSKVKYSCGATHSADISSAQAVFAGYCGMGDGVTSFPVASTLPGVMTYYVTDMPNFSELAPCAQSAVSHGILGQTYSMCPADPAALASCACVKDNNDQEVSKSITSSVKYSCGNTASEDITSALDIYNSYCSAAQGLITPTGVTASVTTSAHGGGIGGVTAAPSGSWIMAPTPTATSPGSSDANAGNSTAGNEGSTSNTALIGGVVGGVVGGLGIGLAALFFFFFRRRREKQLTELLLSSATVGPEKPGTSELAGTFATNPRSSVHGWTTDGHDTVSPLSANVAEMPGGWGIGAELHGSPRQQQHPELHGTPRQQQSELHGSPRNQHGNIYEAGGVAVTPELQGSQNGNVYEAPPNGRPSHSSYEMQAYPTSPDATRLHGPVYEMSTGRARPLGYPSTASNF